MVLIIYFNSCNSSSNKSYKSFELIIDSFEIEVADLNSAFISNSYDSIQKQFYYYISEPSNPDIVRVISEKGRVLSELKVDLNKIKSAPITDMNYFDSSIYFANFTKVLEVSRTKTAELLLPPNYQFSIQNNVQPLLIENKYFSAFSFPEYNELDEVKYAERLISRRNEFLMRLDEEGLHIVDSFGRMPEFYLKHAVYEYPMISRVIINDSYHFSYAFSDSIYVESINSRDNYQYSMKSNLSVKPEKFDLSRSADLNYVQNITSKNTVYFGMYFNPCKIELYRRLFYPMEKYTKERGISPFSIIVAESKGLKSSVSEEIIFPPKIYNNAILLPHSEGFVCPISKKRNGKFTFHIFRT